MFLDVLKGKRSDRVPIWFMRQAGRTLPEYRQLRATVHDFWQLCLSPELVAQITLQPIKRFQLDVAILFSDILLVPLAMGQKGELREGVGPVFDHTFVEKQAFKALGEGTKYFDPVYDAIRLINEQKPDSCSLVGFSGCPWTVACYMVEGQKSRHHEKIKSFAYRDTCRFEALLEAVTQSTFTFLSGQISAGVQAVQLFETWGGILPQHFYERWVLQPVRKLCQRLNESYPEIPIIYFPREASVYSDLVIEQLHGLIRGINLDHVATPQVWRSFVKAGLTCQGGIDPSLLVAGGEVMYDAIREMLTFFRQTPYVFNLSHGLFPHTPISNIQEAINCVRSFTS